jgi:AraC-like DNA-binding protein
MEEKTPLLISQTFDTEDLMIQSSFNWKYHAVYKLMPHAFKGENHIVMLPSLQLSYAQRNGGVLYTVASPKGMVSAGIITHAEGTICFGNIKLQEGDILFFDDKHSNILVANGTFSAAIVSIPRKRYQKYTRRLLHCIDMVIRDTERQFAQTLETLLSDFQTLPSLHSDTLQYTHIEEALLDQLDLLMNQQIPYTPKLTKGEKIALQIRDRIYHRMTKKVTINSLAKEFNISEQTVQNAFKSLFGMTPNRFLRNLKLNHVRKALIHTSPQNDTIVHIANKWGFTHMGHFSRYYTDLFGENPSITLHREPPIDQS